MPALLASLLLLVPLGDVQNVTDVLHAFRPASRIRVVNVWATWCAPCVAEIGEVQAISDHFKDKDVEVIGLSLDDMIPGDRATAKANLGKFLEQRHVRFRNVYFTGRPNELADELRFDGSIPITIVFDSNGHELLRNEGPLDKTWFTKQLETLLAKRRTAK